MYRKIRELLLPRALKKESAINTVDIDVEYEAIGSNFDTDFYLSKNLDVERMGIDPLRHFCIYGWREMRDPCPDFSVSFYLQNNIDVKNADINPFAHYIAVGKNEGRAGNFKQTRITSHSSTHISLSLMASTLSGELREIISVIRPHFDQSYYLRKYPDVADSVLEPVIHFCAQGWHEGKDPTSDFSVITYLDLHPDVALSGVNPFWHYIVAGIDEGRLTRCAQEQSVSDHEPVHKVVMDTIKDAFDPYFYLRKYLDVAKSGANPLEHYCSYGWKEGRDPSKNFSSTFYLQTNPDVEVAGLNPLWHYIVAGKAEGRSPVHPAGYRFDQLSKLQTLEEEVGHWVHKRVPEKLLSHSEIVSVVLGKCVRGKSELLLSVGHDNYRLVSGGVQLCEHREEMISAEKESIYLNLHPWQALPRLAHAQDGDSMIISLLMNGEHIGEVLISDLVKAVSIIAPDFRKTDVVIHQLLGHMLEGIVDIIEATGKKECKLWLHDFITICPSFTLQRNNISFCGAPPLESNSCTLCRFGTERDDHAERITSFFRKIDVHVLSPSQVTADFWSERSGLVPASLLVLPHMTLKWRKRSKQLREDYDRVAIGFLGTPVPHKGWDAFETLSRSIGASGKYRFVFLGASECPAYGIEHRRVHVTAADPEAMIKGVQTEKIDLVLHWASWPETFSLSTFEAYAGGAYVITNETSGNVAATVKRLARGAVLSDELELQAFFVDGRADAMVQSLRAERRRYEVQHQLSRMVHDAVDLPACGVKT